MKIPRTLSKLVSAFNLIFTIAFIFLVFINHNLKTEWKFILAIEIALFLNLLRLSILREKLFKTQQYVISSALIGMLVLNLLLLKTRGLPKVVSLENPDLHFPVLYLVANIVFIVILILHPKNNGA